MLIADQVVTAPCTDPLKERLQTLSGKIHQERNETQNLHRDTWPRSIVRKRSEFGGPGKTSADAHRRLLVRQLSVQHSEGREPSRLRTKA